MMKPEIGEPCNGCGLCCRIRVCGTGSFALGLVERYGERVDGPCPALEQQGVSFTCGLVARPKYYMPANPRGVTVLREAVKLMIGAGAGCDEAGDEPDDIATPKIRAVLERYMARVDRRAMQKAAETLFGPRR
jgi:hypothetical protein